MADYTLGSLARMGNPQAKPAKSPVTWQGGTTCDICQQPIKTSLYDAATIMGPWATMCDPCYTQHGRWPLGTGTGQKYEEQPDGSFLKVLG